MTAYLMAMTEGFLLSLFFFGGLWLTIRTAVWANHPALWFAAGFLVRMSATTMGFYWFSKGRWQLLLLCLAGFLAGRTLFFHYRGKTLPRFARTFEKKEDASRKIETQTVPPLPDARDM